MFTGFAQNGGASERQETARRPPHLVAARLRLLPDRLGVEAGDDRVATHQRSIQENR